MTFDEFETKIAEIANGRGYSCDVRSSRFVGQDKPQREWSCWIAGRPWAHNSATPEIAIARIISLAAFEIEVSA